MELVTFDVDDESYDRAVEAAKRRGTTVEELVREYLQALAKQADENDSRDAIHDVDAATRATKR